MANEEMWLEYPRSSDRYIKGVNAFLKNAFTASVEGNEIRCPCKKCHIQQWHCREVIFDHLICYGSSPTYFQYVYDVSIKDSERNVDEFDCDMSTMFGDDLQTMLRATYRDVINNEESDERRYERANPEARTFYRLLNEGKEPLYPGCKNFSTLSFLVRFYHLKCSDGMTETNFSHVMDILMEAFPFANIPKSFNHAKNTIRDLGLDYNKIDACPNDCSLYWGENESEESCRICGLSRWKVVEQSVDINGNEGNIPHVPAKLMRYFPLKPRLQRLFMSKDLSQLMRWHAVDRKKDGKLRHAADGEAWKAMDAHYPHFASEIRSVRLGIATDGFNPYRTMSSRHSTWPIVLVNYNLPPWLSMKAENLILSTLISGPDSPGNNIDVYMQPLIEELKELWNVGLETYDAMADETFTLYASVLWTISDFPGMAVVAGYSTKGFLACPSCHYETTSMYLKNSKKVCYMGHRKFLDKSHKYRFDKRRFDGKIETGESPKPLSGNDIEILLSDYENDFGKLKRKRKVTDDSPWRKKSILFELPYWRHNLLRHNLDVMHIEKNVFDNIVGTLLNISGKTKDHLNARKDLRDLGIRRKLHPFLKSDGQKKDYPPAIFNMTDEEKDIFCSVLKNVKLPYGSASNISRCVDVKERKLSGYKSHDAHFILQYLLQFAVLKSLKPEVAIPLIRLGAFYGGICQKVIDLGEVKKLQQDIAEILCEFESTYPPSFFDVMVHLQIHLCKEIELGGPVYTRWMFTIEQYLGKLKSYVRNWSKPEASIAEGYLAEECLTFCSRFFGGNESANLSARFQKPNSSNEGYPLGTRRNKNGEQVHLEDDTVDIAHRYILFNSGNKDVEALIEKHRLVVVDIQVKSGKYSQEREHTLEFQKWIKKEITKMEHIPRELAVLSRGPNRSALRFSGYAINGYRFYTKTRDSKCTTQNSGVFYSALTTSFSSRKDENPIVGSVDYYGAIEEIIQLDYWGVSEVVLFRCCWYQQEKGRYGLTRVNANKLCQKNDPFVLASQVEQVFYVQDPLEKGVRYVARKIEIESYNVVQQVDYGPEI